MAWKKCTAGCSNGTVTRFTSSTSDSAPGMVQESCSTCGGQGGWHVADPVSRPSRSNDGGSGPCFITTACCTHANLPDDCHELTVLRGFRDTYMAAVEGGEEEVLEYYKIAPQILAAMKSSKAPSNVYEMLFSKVKQAVKLVEEGKLHEAHQLYKNTVLQLKEQYLVQ